jgi:hypothetical protein
MKAFKQIDLSRETRIVFGYAAMMCLLGFLILLSPVFAQDDSLQTIEPKVHIDVKRDYDPYGNLSRYDSVYSWYWSGRGNLPEEYDSIFRQFYDPNLGFGSGHKSVPPLMPYYPEGDSADSLRYSLFDYYFGRDWFNNFWFPFHDVPGMYDWDLPFDDSLGISFYDFDDMQKFFDKRFDHKDMVPDEEYFRKLDKQHKDFMDRYKQYMEENRKLIEKYFGNPLPGNDTLPGLKPDKFNPGLDDDKPAKKGTI